MKIAELRKTLQNAKPNPELMEKIKKLPPMSEKEAAILRQAMNSMRPPEELIEQFKERQL